MYKDKKIIMIHGLASKPPMEDTHRLWTKALIENIREENKEVAEKMERSEEIFSSAYWANAIPSHVEDDASYVIALEKQVDEVIKERQELKEDFHVGVSEKIGDFFKDRGLDMVNILTGALSIKDSLMKTFLRETELYSMDQYVADKIRKPLEDEIRKAWNDNKEVVILSHSMGTFIAYDVLWRFSHRSDEHYRKYKGKKIKMLVTMGSPLGNNAIKNILFAKYHKSIEERQYPTNIDYWHNYSCLGDVVAHDAELSDDFFEEMQRLKLIKNNVGNTEKYTIDYTDMHNPFKVVSHAGNKDKSKSNPHKSYGYLVQPRLGSWLVDFMEGNLK